jgi:hypothetical protein
MRRCTIEHGRASSPPRRFCSRSQSPEAPLCDRLAGNGPGPPSASRSDGQGRVPADSAPLGLRGHITSMPTRCQAPASGRRWRASLALPDTSGRQLDGDQAKGTVPKFDPYAPDRPPQMSAAMISCRCPSGLVSHSECGRITRSMDHICLAL